MVVLGVEISSGFGDCVIEFVIETFGVEISSGSGDCVIEFVMEIFGVEISSGFGEFSTEFVLISLTEGVFLSCLDSLSSHAFKQSKRLSWRSLVPSRFKCTSSYATCCFTIILLLSIYSKLLTIHRFLNKPFS